MAIRKISIETIIAAVGIILTVTATGLTATYAGMLSATRIIFSNGTVIAGTNEATYIIFTDGTTYYAKNGTTGSIDMSSTNAGYLIDSLLLNGSSFLFDAGTYQFDAPIKVSGNINTVFRGKGNSTIFNMMASSTGPIFLVKSSGSTVVTDMQLQNLNVSINQKLIQIEAPACNVQLEGLTLNNMGFDDIIVWGYSAPVQNLQITNCQFNSLIGYGIFMRYAYNVLIENNHFLNVRYAAVGSNSQSRYVNVTNNVVDWSNDTAFDFEEVDAEYPNYSTWTYSITNNTIKSTGGSAIYCINSHDGVIAYNSILNATGLGGMGSIVFATDTIVPAGNSLNDSIIYGNVIDHVYVGICAYGQDNGRSISNLIIENNSVSNCQWSGMAIGGWSNNITAEGNNINAMSLAGKGQYDGITNCGGGHSVFSDNTISDPNGMTRNGFFEEWYDYNNITGNIFQGMNHPINITSGQIHDIITNNSGYNPVGNIAKPVSGSLLVNEGGLGAITNNTQYTNIITPKIIYISGGTVVSVAVNGQTAYKATNCSVVLQPSDTFKVIWNSQPSITVVGQ